VICCSYSSVTFPEALSIYIEEKVSRAITSFINEKKIKIKFVYHYPA
jgi:hypothetical protein